MKFPHASPLVSCRQVASTGTARSLIGPGDSMITNRVLLKASAAGIFLGDSNVSTSNGAELPSGAAAAYLEIWTQNPQNLFVVGTGTVYAVFEEPEGNH